MTNASNSAHFVTVGKRVPPAKNLRACFRPAFGRSSVKSLKARQVKFDGYFQDRKLGGLRGDRDIWRRNAAWPGELASSRHSVSH
jgi:hypothetical protein